MSQSNTAFVLGPRNQVYTITLALFLHSMAMVSHHVSRTTDPGVVPFKSVQRGKTKKRYICEKTKGLKPTGSHFCSRVGRVVLRMDHFCPWTNNTVGIYTQKSYILFVTYTFMSCVLAVVSISSRFLSCRRSRLRRVLDASNRARYEFKPWCRKVSNIDLICCVLSLVLVLIFAIFTACMLWDQFRALYDNTPYIDRLQGRRGRKQPIRTTLRLVFGETFTWRWFVPLAPTLELRRHFAGIVKDSEECSLSSMIKLD